MGIPRALATWKRATRVGRQGRKPNRCFPRVEGLEGRALLSVLTVMNDGDSGPGSLRALIAGAATGDVINFSQKLDGDIITLTSGEIDPPCSLTIQGPEANLLAISGNQSSGIFDLQNVSLSISGLTLENGHSVSGAAISLDEGNQSLNVSQCIFDNNVAQSANGYFLDAYGGAIAASGPVTIDQCDFTGNAAIAASGSTFSGVGVGAHGGAIWFDDSNAILQVTNSHFTSNHAVAGSGLVGGDADGGAIACEQGGTGFLKNAAISITGSSFNQNSASGGNALNQHAGGNATGGAISIVHTNEQMRSATVSNDQFNGNFVEAGAGSVGGHAEGGSLAIDAAGDFDSNFHADNDHFNNSTAIGGNASGQASGAVGSGGTAYGGAVAFSTDGSGATFTFNGDQVTSATAQGGGASGQLNGSAGYAKGGDAGGGGLYLDATGSDHAKLTVSGDTFNSDKAIGGAGGNAGLNGLSGGDASGGGIAAVVGNSSVRETEAGAKLTINGTAVTNSSATGGAGGGGIQPMNGAGGNGGNGGNSFGGGISLDPGNSFASVFNLTNDQLTSDTAMGGHGGNGASGTHGFNGGNGASGGQGNGGGLAVTLGINGYANEGNGTASLLRVNVANSHLLVDKAIGGVGGYAGNGLHPGIAGGGGNASGGAVSLRGLVGDPTNLVTLDTDFLFASTAQGGAGGLGGVGIAVPGGAGGYGGAGYGGGIDVSFKGGTHFLNATILGNHAVGGKGGNGGSGLGGFGPTGQKGLGVGGGVRVSASSGVTAGKDINTVIIVNSADIGPDVFGTLGNI